MKTQLSSKPRLKRDTIGEDGLKEMFAKFESLSTDDFRTYCIDLVNSGGGSEPTKQAIIREMLVIRSKPGIMMKASNFVLAGMGLGV